MNAKWIASICGVAVLTLLVLFLFSFDTLEFQEMGLNYSWMRESIEGKPYTSGRYYLGIGNHFIKFPRMVKSVFFVDEDIDGRQGPPLVSRTRDGLTVRLEISFQYRLKYDELYQLYSTLGKNYEEIFVRMAIEQLTTAATMHNAHFFFANRTDVGQEMHQMLDKHFKDKAFSEVPFFQLRTVHLPSQFEDAIRETQVKQQEIQIAQLEQKTNSVTFQTQVLQAQQKVHVLQNQAEAEAASITAANVAFCKQYLVTQQLQAESLMKLKQAAGWNPDQLLSYLRIRAVREHPSEKTTIRL